MLIDVFNMERDVLNAYIEFREALFTVSLLPLLRCPKIILFNIEALLTLYRCPGGPCYAILVKYALLYATFKI